MILDDVCELIVDCPHSTAPDEGIGYPLIRTPNIGKGRFLLEGVHRVSEEVYKQRTKRAIPKDNDIIFAREAPAGNAAIIKNGSRFCLGQRTVLIRPNPNKVNPDYLMYYLLVPEQQHKLLGTAHGATVSHVNIPDIHNMNVDNLPSLETQEKVAEILRAYDDLIENNQKQIKLLEEAAQRLYKEWFIDLRFPGHESTPIVNGLPEGWEEKRAEYFFEISIGKTPPRAEAKWFLSGDSGIPWVSITDMGSSGAYILKTDESLSSEAISSHNVKIIPKGTVLLSFKLTVGRVSITTEEMCTNEAIAHFRVDDETRGYTYLYLKTFEYEKLGNTSAISKAVNSKIVKAMPFIMPGTKTLASFAAIVNPILNEIYNKQYQNLQLAEVRDRLLPKLMNGELEV